MKPRSGLGKLLGTMGPEVVNKRLQEKGLDLATYKKEVRRESLIRACGWATFKDLLQDSQNQGPYLFSDQRTIHLIIAVHHAQFPKQNFILTQIESL